MGGRSKVRVSGKKKGSKRSKRGSRKSSKQSRRSSIVSRTITVRGRKVNPKSRVRRAVKSMTEKANISAELSNISHFLSPCTAYDFRWPTESGITPSSTKTGAVVLHNVAQYTNSSGFTGTYCGGNQAAKGTQVYYLFRNPLRAAVVLTTVSTAATYNFYLPTGLLTFAPVASGNPADIPFSYASSASTTNAPHGSYLYMGGLASRPEMSFIWMNAGDLIQCITAGSGSPNDYISVYQVDSPGSLSVQANPIGVPFHITTLTTQTVFTAAACGYYGFQYVTLASSVTWTVAFNLVVGVGDCFSHIPVPYAQAHPTYMSNVRLLSSSLLLSDVASLTNVEGTIYGAVISDGTPFYTHTTCGDLTSKADHFRGVAKKGLYTWLRPGGEGAFSYRKAMAVDPASGRITDTTFMLDDGSTYQVALVYTTGVTLTSYPGLDFLTAFSFCLEFKSDDQWVELEYPSLTTEAAVRSLEVALRASSFSENPLHLADIRAFASKAGRFLRQHSEVIGNTLSVMFPTYSAPIRAVGKFLQT